MAGWFKRRVPCAALSGQQQLKQPDAGQQDTPKKSDAVRDLSAVWPPPPPPP
eukprot:CAMPEP_0179318386 /NCGR_PEP_ID=MMETSP0797-20121207/56844_1 /TAXON_ID=47934 /ORGANISM="Dinophysis acuminata, Strain DAEP01" /LENGTH=51 /DNA_ID=CAMNT_0021029527 /DNA_START=56 /DNA_END=208 /DNA_ORIENTATION=-